MVTNQVMIRPMGDFSVCQRTKDGMFNATDLVRQWNTATRQNKEIKEYFKNKSTGEFITALILEENLKGENSTHLSTRGKNGGTWMHPLLFLDFAMWLNPAFKVKVLKFIYDQMIKFRNDSGDAYRELSAAVATIVRKEDMPVRMAKIAEAINYVTFAEHYPNIRNAHGSEKEMQELFLLEKKLADLINDGFIKNFDSLIEYLRKQWFKKHTPQLFNQ